MSFGINIKEPARLETRLVEDVLKRIQLGEWREDIERLRRLPEARRDKAKEALPFFTPSGQFAYRNNQGLVRYSGLVVVDLDDLPPKRITRLLQTAVGDRHCFAGFRSPSGRGLKLLFRVSRKLGPVHSQIFPQVVAHVRRRYRVDPDQKRSQSDVSRACFVSWDSGAWIFTGARALPITEPAARLEKMRPTKPAGVRPEENHFGTKDFEKLIGAPRPGDRSFEMLGWECGPREYKADETHTYTNSTLLTLARRFTTDLMRLPSLPKEKEIQRLLAMAFRGWASRARRGNIRRPLRVYWKELLKMVGRQLKSDHPGKNASHWTRWREHPDFPHSGTSREKILFAIKKNCEERGSKRFYLGQRDAGRIAGISHVHGGKNLEKLRLEGKIGYDPGWLKSRPGQRKARFWVLLEA